MLLWEKEKITARALSMMVEPNEGCLTLNLTSDQPGEAGVLVWNPADQSWTEQDKVTVQANRLCTLTTPAYTKVRLAFTPAQKSAVVSAWATQ
jgi:hypothetical protein